MAISVTIAVASAVTTAHTPATAESDVEPQARYHDGEWESSQRDGRSGVALMSTANLRRIECARRRCALADDLILRGVDGKVRIGPIALAFLARGSLGAREPPKAEAKHDDRGDDAEDLAPRTEWYRKTA